MILRAYLMDSYSVESNKMSKKNRKQLLKNCVEQLKAVINFSFISFKFLSNISFSK